MQNFLRSGYTLIGLLLGVVGISPCFGQVTSESLSQTLAEVCQKHEVPALAVAVVETTGPIQAACYGIRKRGTADAVELSDRFPIGSCTKSMTATLAAVMVEAGQIEWTTTIAEVWPEDAKERIAPALQVVTLNELLSHQSGLPKDLDAQQAWRSFFDETQSPEQERQRMLQLLLPQQPKLNRGKFSYSNLGYVVVAAMLEKRAGEPYEALVKKHLFDPLNMPSADFRTLKSVEQPQLWGHKAKNGEPINPSIKGAENPSVYAPCGTVHLAIEDYARYAQWHLTGQPEPVLKAQAAFDHLHQPQIDHTPPQTKYGCGWICLETGLGSALHHAGSNNNSFALIWILPEAKFAVVVCTNTGETQAFPACDEVASRMIKHYSERKNSN